VRPASPIYFLLPAFFLPAAFIFFGAAFFFAAAFFFGAAFFFIGFALPAGFAAFLAGAGVAALLAFGAGGRGARTDAGSDPLCRALARAPPLLRVPPSSLESSNGSASDSAVSPATLRSPRSSPSESSSSSDSSRSLSNSSSMIPSLGSGAGSLSPLRIKIQRLLERPAADGTEPHGVPGKHDAVALRPVIAFRLVVCAFVGADLSPQRRAVEEGRVPRHLAVEQRVHVGLGLVRVAQRAPLRLILGLEVLELLLRPGR